MKAYDFANILFTGPCNLNCPHCIGRRPELRGLPENLHRFPPENLEELMEELHRRGIREISVTGTNTDPQLYPYERELLDRLRRGVPGARISLHTNGVLALEKMETFNLYDRAAVSLPSFRPETCRKMTGGSWTLPLEAILEKARVPVKISVLVTEDNAEEVPEILDRCEKGGVRRAALRTLYGKVRLWKVPGDLELVGDFAGSPVYRRGGLQATVWDFSRSRLKCLNLFSDGSLSDDYLLVKGRSCGDSKRRFDDAPAKE